MKKTSKFKLLDHAFLTAAVFIAAGYFLLKTLGKIPVGHEANAMIETVAFLAIWILYLKANKGILPESGLKKRGGIRKNWFKLVLLVLPHVIYGLLSLTLTVSKNGGKLIWDTKVFLFALIMSLEAGISEEILCRGIPLSNGMRVIRTRGQAMLLCLFTSIVFGGLHFFNLYHGATLSGTIVQVFGASGIGFFFAAVYLRSGSLIPGIFAHFFNDFCQVYDPYAKVADQMELAKMTTNVSITAAFIAGIIAATIWFSIGLFLLRKKKWKDIRENFGWE